jgi:hypothetical protein
MIRRPGERRGTILRKVGLSGRHWLAEVDGSCVLYSIRK